MVRSPSTEFKSQGKRSTTRVQLTEGSFAGAWGFTLPDEERLGIRAFPQAGFARSADGPFEWYMLDELPTKDDLKAKGYAGECHMRLCECPDVEAVTALLRQKGIDYSSTESFAPESGPMWAEHVFRPNLHHQRAFAKIAMNYVAHQCGRDVALEPRFDAMRDLVMRGIKPERRYYAIDEHPIVEGDKQGTRRLFGHMLVVNRLKDGVGVEGIVSLYNRFRHGFCLSVEPGFRYAGVFGPAAEARSMLRALIPATRRRRRRHMRSSRHADPHARPPAAVGRPAAPGVRRRRPDLPLWWTPQRHRVRDRPAPGPQPARRHGPTR